LDLNWKAEARRKLRGLRAGRSAWSYRRDRVSCVEPTCLASLALIASGERNTYDADRADACAAADWVAALQKPDGALPVSKQVPSPGWSTPCAILLWRSLDTHPEPCRRACSWLLRVAGETHQPKPGDDVVGHDPSLAGWPWVEGTHSWIEPTAMSILALCRAGMSEHARAREGARMIIDRALEQGGWNCGNKTVFGRELRPQPFPTALSLLALAARSERCRAVDRALAYLQRVLPTVRAPISLGWGVLALRAHLSLPAPAERWLAESAADILETPDSVPGLALLLLAASGASLDLLMPRSPRVGTLVPASAAIGGIAGRSLT
jgi:hypothetical protein